MTVSFTAQSYEWKFTNLLTCELFVTLEAVLSLFTVSPSIVWLEGHPLWFVRIDRSRLWRESYLAFFSTSATTSTKETCSGWFSNSSKESNVVRNRSSCCFVARVQAGKNCRDFFTVSGEHVGDAHQLFLFLTISPSYVPVASFLAMIKTQFWTPSKGCRSSHPECSQSDFCSFSDAL